MFEKELHTINLSGTEYPIKCSISVLEKIQDAYGSIEEFEKKIQLFDENEKFKMPDLQAVGDGLFWMCQEGADITEAEELTREKIMHEADSFINAALEIHSEFMRCFDTKNRMSTKMEKTQEKTQP